MNKLNIGIIREGKIPPDKRVAMMPDQCVELMEQFKDLSISVQPSDIRCFINKEYYEKGIVLSEDLAHCDTLFGIKEVPIHLLIPGKRYFFFSHTLKKQPYNQKLLQAIIEKKITLIDYEVLTDPEGNRLIAFGKYAGIVGAYNALLLYGKKYDKYHLKRAFDCFDLSEVFQEMEKIVLPPVKIAVTGTGRVGKGAKESLLKAGIREVSVQDYLQGDFDEAVFTMLSSADYHQKADGGPMLDRSEFHHYPERFRSDFDKFFTVTDILIAGAYWDPRAPKLFTNDDMLRNDFRIRIIADITCDINGSIPSTIKPCTIYDPAYDYDPSTQSIEPLFSSDKHITVMAIDNLPGEVPRDASKDFGAQLMKHIFPILITGNDKEGILERGTMTRNGCLTERFQYLSDYVQNCS